MGHSWVSIAGWATLLFSLAISWWKGAWAERWGAVLLFCSNVSSDLMMALYYPDTPQLSLFAIDLMLAVGLLALAVKFNSLWLSASWCLLGIEPARLPTSTTTTKTTAQNRHPCVSASC